MDLNIATRTVTDAQILEAEKLFNQARNRLSDLKARKQKAASQEKRKLDDRRKILAGAVVLKLAQSDKDFAAALRGILDKGLTRPIDRDAFPELQQSKS